MGEVSPFRMSSENYTIHVIDIPLDANEEDLLRVFEKVGHIDRIHLYRDKGSGRSLGRALVVYEYGSQPNPVELAIVELKDEKINGQNIRITAHSADTSRYEEANLFVGFLGRDVDDLRLREMFEPFGDIVFCKVQTSPFGRRRCCGQVQFEKKTAAEHALEIMNGWTDKNGKKLKVEWFATSKHSSTSRIFVKHLPSSINHECALEAMFRRFGQVKDVLLCCDELDVPRGFGFVSFRQPKDASAAILEMNGIRIEDTRLRVERAHPHPDRRKY